MEQPVLLPRRMIAETLGSGLLALAVVGSGIAAERLAPTNPGEALGIKDDLDAVSVRLDTARSESFVGDSWGLGPDETGKAPESQ